MTMRATQAPGARVAAARSSVDTAHTVSSVAGIGLDGTAAACQRTA
jgi:hypothetical protein